ncbi:MAG: hypothetical protein K0Q85_588 [Caproiciproducens sp.]|nr:hypothetical protein [Caproiciproducens sp.]
MNCSVFKDEIIWNNIGEVAIQTGIKSLSLYNCALLRQAIRSFTGVSLL